MLPKVTEGFQAFRRVLDQAKYSLTGKFKARSVLSKWLSRFKGSSGSVQSRTFLELARLKAQNELQ
jgi:hypothetical protein